MTPEAQNCLRKARTYLRRANNWLKAIDEGDEAAWVAYLAGFHTAQALIVERTSKIAKTHRGLRSEFARLVVNEPQFDQSLTPFLGRGYRRKEAVDYDVSSDEIVSQAEAREMIETATSFVDCIAEILA